MSRFPVKSLDYYVPSCGSVVGIYLPIQGTLSSGIPDVGKILYTLEQQDDHKLLNPVLRVRTN